MAFTDSMTQAYAFTRSRSNTSSFIAVCILYVLLQVYLEEQYPEIAKAFSNLTVCDIYFLMVGNYSLRKGLNAAHYGSAYSFLHFANSAAHLGNRYIKWSAIGFQRYESLFESLEFFDTIWHASGPLPTIIITLNILYYLLVFLKLVHENHESLPDRLQVTEKKLAKAEAQIQETKLAHGITIANFEQAQTDFNTSTADHFTDMTTITTRYLLEKKNNAELLSKVETLEKASTENTAENKLLKAENKRLNIRLVSPKRKIRPSPNASQEKNISKAQSIANKEELIALQKKFNILSEKMDQLTKTSNAFNAFQDQGTKISSLEAGCKIKDVIISELETTVQTQATATNKLEKAASSHAATFTTLETDCEIKDSQISELETSAQSQTVTISKLEKAAKSHTTTIDTLNSTLESKDKEIEDLKQQSKNDSQLKDHEIKSPEPTNEAQKSTIATLEAKLKSADDRETLQTKTHRQAISDKIRTIKELNDQHDTDLAQIESEKAAALKNAADTLARIKQEHATTLLLKADEIKAARKFFAQTTQDPSKDVEITTLKTELATLRQTFDVSLQNAKDAIWKEAEENTSNQMLALDNRWSKSWDDRVSKYEIDWEKLEEDLKTATDSIEKLKKELDESKQEIKDLETVIAEWEGTCEDLERQNLELERKVKKLEAAKRDEE